MANLFNIHRPLRGSFLGGVELLSGNRSNWEKSPYPFPFPAIITVQDPGLLADSGQSVNLTYGSLRTVVKIKLQRWFNLLSNAATYNEYEQALREFKIWFSQIDNEVANSGSPMNMTYWATRSEWQSIVSLYRSYENQLANKGNQLVEAARVQATDLQNKKSQTELSAQTRDNAESFYNEQVSNLNFIIQTTNVAQRFRSWQAYLAVRATVNAKWEKWKLLLSNPSDYQIVSNARKLYEQANTNLFSVIEQKIAAELKHKQIQDPNTKESYGSLATNSKMRTGIWNKLEEERENVIESQIREAAYNMDIYTAKLTEALKIDDKARKLAIRNDIVPKATNYAAGVSAGVKDTALWAESLRNYNQTLIQLNTQLGESTGANWGLILALGGAAAGAFMFLS